MRTQPGPPARLCRTNSCFGVAFGQKLGPKRQHKQHEELTNHVFWIPPNLGALDQNVSSYSYVLFAPLEVSGAHLYKQGSPVMPCRRDQRQIQTKEGMDPKRCPVRLKAFWTRRTAHYRPRAWRAPEPSTAQNLLPSKLNTRDSLSHIPRTAASPLATPPDTSS